MRVSHNIAIQKKLRNYSKYLIYLVIALGIFVIIGWQFDIDFLKSPIPNLASMNPTSALLFILIGISFIYFLPENSLKKTRTVGYVFISVVFIIAFIKFTSFFTGFGIGIDHLFFPEKIDQYSINNIPNKMAPNTALCFLLLSITLLTHRFSSPNKILLDHFNLLTVALIALFSILGYMYRVQAFYGVLSYIPMAIHTAVGFMLTTLAILFSAPDKGLMKELTSTYNGSQTARLLIPAAILIPISLGYIRLLGHWSGTFSTEFGVAILISSIVILFVLLIWHNSISLNKKDALRNEAEEKLELLNKELESRVHQGTLEYRSLVEQASDGIFISDKAGKYVDVNLSACNMLGYSKEELLTMTIKSNLAEEEVKNNPIRFDELLAGKTILNTRNLIKKDGTLLPVEINAKMLSNGKMLGMVRDITERKIAEEKLIASERQFRLTLDNMLEGVQMHDFNWRYIYANDALIKYSKYTRDELLGYTIMEKYPGIEQTNLYKVLQKCMVERVTEHLETEFTYPDGSEAYFELSIQPIPTGLFILSIDITERKKAKEKIQKLNEELEQKVIERTTQLGLNIQQLKESEDKFQKAFQASAAGMSITRLSDSVYLDVNNAFIEITGYTKEELLYHTSSELGMIVNPKQHERVLHDLKEHGSAKHFEMTIKNKRGEIIQVLCSVETILLNGEKHTINIVFDITDRKKSEEQLELVNIELESFSYSVSHDLRAPLRAIEGYAKMLEEDYCKLFDDNGNRLLRVIQQNATKMSHLIDDLLSFSRLGRKELQKIDLNMNELVERVLIEINRTTKHHAEIKTKLLHATKGDYNLVNQILINLISNAIKYSAKKTHPIIELFSELKSEEIVYTIKDNGVGFDMAYSDKLFGVFQRLHKESEFEGTGVGLAIVKRIVNKHGGEIWAEGVVGVGATFSFTLPIK